jgi:hypothetical protein
LYSYFLQIAARRWMYRCKIGARCQIYINKNSPGIQFELFELR